MRPAGIESVTFGPALTASIRKGNTRGLFERRTVVSLLIAENAAEAARAQHLSV